MESLTCREIRRPCTHRSTPCTLASPHAPPLEGAALAAPPYQDDSLYTARPAWTLRSSDLALAAPLNLSRSFVKIHCGEKCEFNPTITFYIYYSVCNPNNNFRFEKILSHLYFITISPIYFSVWDRNKKIIYVDTMFVSTYDVCQVQTPEFIM
jgi:hypothetical protein